MPDSTSQFESVWGEYPAADPNLEQITREFKKNKVKKILDLGCGAGRNSIYLAKRGFALNGIDISKEGIELTKEKFRKKGLKGRFKIASCYKRLPYQDDYFDAVISIQVIHHATEKKIKRCINEIKRVLKKGGFLFLTVTKNKKGGRATKIKQVGRRTYVMLDGPEKGIPHYIFNKSLLKKFLKDFHMPIVRLDKTNHYILLATLK